MAAALRSEVLQSFKSLHKARKIIFSGDRAALEAGRIKINEEFKKNKHVIEQHSISELLQLSRSVEKELRTSVIQAEEIEPGKYEAKITSETIRMDNVPYNDCGVIKGKKSRDKN